MPRKTKRNKQIQALAEAKRQKNKYTQKKSTRQRGPKLEAAGARSGRAAMMSFYGDARGQYRPRRRHFRFLKTILTYLLLIEYRATGLRLTAKHDSDFQ
ncbi:hypothetical protein JG688_00010320 [Phytophthora aleatoria]|uniref:Uncharacterized protein n=1 Tax=Phytophthora aleatoria TaxID=2496075 RepID=A0A8J5IW90_9STRA|nr:hypothetical protein JG688_00010320 [Phytophthora aleatoria]